VNKLGSMDGQAEKSDNEGKSTGIFSASDGVKYRRKND
jgi:hypothetical protein